jgi:hypothetical protein
MRVKVSDLRMRKAKYDFLFLDAYLMEHGKQNREIENTPHYKLLKEYENNPNLNLKNTDYFTMAKRHLDHVGRWFWHKDEKGIIRKMNEFLKLYNNIKEKGYDFRKDSIIVECAQSKNAGSKGRTKAPYVKAYYPEGFEIWEGHHRVAILAKLGYEEIEVDQNSRLNVAKNFIVKILSKFKE